VAAADYVVDVSRSEIQGVKSNSNRMTMGSLSKDRLSWLVDQGVPATVWGDGSDKTFDGTLYRDVRSGFLLRASRPWIDGQMMGPQFVSVPFLNGRTADGPAFSMLDVQVESGILETVIRAGMVVVGATVDGGGELRLDEIAVYLGGLTDVIATPSFVNRVNGVENGEIMPLPSEMTVGSVTVGIERSIRGNAYGMRAENFRIKLKSTTQRSISWWLEEWVNPLTQLVAFMMQQPTSLNYVTAISNSDHGDHQHSEEVYVTGAGWPSLDPKSLVPEVKKGSQRREPLIYWEELSPRLGSAMREVRKMRRGSSGTWGGTMECIFRELGPAQRFVTRVQALEAHHVAQNGRFRPGSVNVDQLLERLKTKGVNSRDRSKVKKAFGDAGEISYRLDERLTQTAATIEATPDLIARSVRFSSLIDTKWATDIASARNKISHGADASDNRWLSEASDYLQLLTNASILNRLGFTKKQARRAALRHGRREMHW